MLLKLIGLRLFQRFLSPTYLLDFWLSFFYQRILKQSRQTYLGLNMNLSFKSINGESQRRKTSIALHLFSRVLAAISSY